MAITEEEIKRTLTEVKYPGFTRDIVSFGLVKGIRIDGDAGVGQSEIIESNPGYPGAAQAKRFFLLY